jgi:RNA polymerase sigma factor (sigma-70 family)
MNVIISRGKGSSYRNARAVLALDRLDRLLSVSPDRFVNVAKRLARFFQNQDLDIDIVGYRDRRLVFSSSPHSAQADVKGSGLYQSDLRRLPAMDRDEELRMAKRHEFFKVRVQCALEQLGLAPDAAASLVAAPRAEVLAHTGRSAATGYLVRCLAQLEQLRNLYVEGALHIVLGTVARYRCLGVDVQDLIQEGNASLFQAIDGFDWRRDVRFRTYAQYWVQQAVLKMLYNSSRTVRVPIWVQKMLGRIRRMQESSQRKGQELSRADIARELGVPESRVAQVMDSKRFAVSLDATVSDTEGSFGQTLADESLLPVTELIAEGNLGESLRSSMQDLPDRERIILERRFGLRGREPETLGEIAIGLGITAERVRQLQNSALARMQRPSKLQQLRAFVEQV